MNLDHIMVVAHPDHPYYFDLIKKYKVRTIDEAINSFETYEIIIDLSPLRTQKKFLFLKELARTSKALIISDLTFSWGEWILKYAPTVVGAVSTLFYSPTKAYEFYVRDNLESDVKEKIHLTLKQFSEVTNHKMVSHQEMRLGFHFPKTIAMIINEAYFALGEKLATPDDIDLAMKNGVNYPLGPIEWGQKIGLHQVALLLEELHTITRDDRYRLSPQLKLEAFKNL